VEPYKAHKKVKWRAKKRAIKQLKEDKKEPPEHM